MSKAVQINGFSYTYPDGTRALSDVTLTVEHGQKVALIGPNGSGKSTLLLAIAAFAKGTGTICLDGLHVNEKNTKKIRRLVGCCFENPDDQLFMPTLFDDVAFGPLNMGLISEQIKTRVSDALRTVGLENMAERAPHHLSAGQKRSAAIATILAMSPKIITLDEPDGSLDPASRKNLVKLLRTLDQTLIIATCNMDFAASIAQRAVLLDQGRVVAQGPARKLMCDAELMEDHGLETPAKIT